MDSDTLYGEKTLTRHLFSEDLSKETELKKHLAGRTDMEARRIERYLAMPDLSRTEGSPLHEIAERVTSLPLLQNFDIIKIPEIVPTDITFDLFNFAQDHVARSKSDTYYVDETHILRTHTTVMWWYYFNHPEIKARIEERKPVGVLSFGKVFRKDEIDRRHMNIFHQMEGLYLIPDSLGTLSLDELKKVLSEIVKTVFGEATEFRFNPDTFPYTDPSLEVEVKVGDQWVEILGSGMPKASVLKNFGVEGYHGWAFGFGLERLAIIGMELPDIRLLWSEDERVKRQLKLGQKYVEVSKYPPIVRDISFIVPKTFIPNDYFDLVRDTAGERCEEVTLLDKYENDSKFGEGYMSYAYRITYRAIDRTLTSEEIDALHKALEVKTVETYGATIR